MELDMEYTVEMELATNIIGKVTETNAQRITQLHDHERQTLSEFILGHEPNNTLAKRALNNQSFDLFELANIGKKILIKNYPDYPYDWYWINQDEPLDI